MRELSSFVWLPLTLGFAATAPFFVMELVNRPPNVTELPIVLFVTMWAAASIAVLTFRHVIRTGVSDQPFSLQNAVFALCIVGLVVTAAFWVGIVNDQMPCFMGVPNCD